MLKVGIVESERCHGPRSLQAGFRGSNQAPVESSAIAEPTPQVR